MFLFFVFVNAKLFNHSELKLQISKFALVSSFGGVVAQIGALTPAVRTATSVIVGPTYDTETLAKVIHEERFVLYIQYVFNAI